MIHRRLRNKERGATAIEYGLIAALIAAVLVSIITVTGVNLSKVYCYVAGEVGVAGGVENVCNDLNGGIDDPDDPDPTDPTLVISPNLPTLWIPPSFIDSSIGTPAQVGSGLSGGDPGVSVPMGWQYDGDGTNFDYNPVGKSRLKIVGSIQGKFYIKLVDQCIPGGFSSDGCAYTGWDGQLYNRNMSNIPRAYCVNNPTWPVWIDVINGVPPANLCGDTSNVDRIVFSGTMNGPSGFSGAVMTSTYKRNPQVTTQVMCQDILLGDKHMYSFAGAGTAPSASCPAGSVAIGIVVNGDTAALDGKIADVSLADYLAYAQNFADWHIESTSTGCALKNSNSVSIPLVLSDCDSARSSGLLN